MDCSRARTTAGSSIRFGNGATSEIDAWRQPRERSRLEVIAGIDDDDFRERCHRQRPDHEGLRLAASRPDPLLEDDLPAPLADTSIRTM